MSCGNAGRVEVTIAQGGLFARERGRLHAVCHRRASALSCAALRPMSTAAAASRAGIALHAAQAAHAATPAPGVCLGGVVAGRIGCQCAEARLQVRLCERRTVCQDGRVLRLAKRLLQLVPKLPLKQRAVEGPLRVFTQDLVLVVGIPHQVAYRRKVEH